MEATGISHIAVCVSDMDKSLAFYRDILGMKISKDEIEDTSTGGLTHTYKHNRKTRRMKIGTDRLSIARAVSPSW